MNKDFSKNKEKRSRSSSSEANNSFVKNVTSRVSGLLPAAVTKWFSSPSSSANGSAPVADATDSSTEDEAPDNSVTSQPPPKRRRFASPGNYNHYNATETNCITTEHIHELPCSPYGTVQSPPGRTTFRRETNFVSTPLRPAEETAADMTKSDTTNYKPQHSVSSIGSSVATKRKSLFDSLSSAESSAKACARSSINTIRDPSQPCFKPTLLGSPFYPGRTMYGGASACYINHPNIKQRKNALVIESNDIDNTVSHSTRRIMDLLENYSSPINEAKRIPTYTRTSRNSSLSNSFSSPSPPVTKAISYKTQELHVPSIASILRLKQRSRLMDTTTLARQIIASHSSTIGYPYPSTSSYREQTEKEPSKLTTKVKSRLTRPNRGEGGDETELPEPLNLPSAVLQIDQNNLPKFSFGTPTSTAIPTPSVSETSTKITETPQRKPDIVTSANPYKFSSPVRISSDAPEPKNTPPKFTFGSPERSVDKIVENKDNGSSVIGTTKSKDTRKDVAKEKDWKCSDCWVTNKSDVEQCVCCGGKKPSDTSKSVPKCSICKFSDSQPQSDKCINCNKLKMNNISKPTTKPDDSKWKCEDCWVSNDSNAEVCVCCGGRNPKKPTVIIQNPLVNDKESEWKCEDCWVKNKNSVNKCACCGASKPGSKPASTATGLFNTNAKPPDNTFKKIINTQTDKWECPSCLVRNDGDKTKCVCCETEREGTTKENDKKSFNFGVPNTSFKFGIDKAQVTSTPKPAEVKIATESKKEESETNNNVLSQTPSFTFGLPAKKVEDQTDSVPKAEPKTDSAPKATFSFGIPKPTTSEPTGSTPVKLAPKPAEEDKEKPQVVPKIDLTVQKSPEAPKPVANIFAAPLPASQSAQEKTAAPVIEKPVTSTPILSATLSLPVEKKEPPSNPLLPKSETATTTAAQVSTTFTFGSNTLKLSPNLFAPATTTSTNSPFGSPQSTTTSIFQKNELTTTSSAMSVFPKLDTVSLFQKNETTVTTAPPTAAPAPLFSFGTAGGITQTQPAQTEKPKFNFTFGSNTKTETPVFKPPENKFTFGAPTENKFALPTANSIGGISISGNTMGGGNGLPAGNILSGGNGLPSTITSSSDLTSHNPLSGGNGLPASNALQAPSGGIFGSAVQKENVWSVNNTNNMFGSNANTQKPPAFSFGTSTPFNANSPPAFGSSPNVFGMNQTSTNQPSMFSSPTPAGSMFGSPSQPAPAPSMGMFGSPSVGATPAFGAPNPSIPSLTPTPAPAFNFGGQNQSAGIFGFGQQQQQQPQGAGVYSFGAPAGGPQVQFNMGSAPNAAVSQRRMRKAVRRTTPR